MNCISISIKSININPFKIRKFRLKSHYHTDNFASSSATKIQHIYFFQFDKTI